MDRVLKRVGLSKRCTEGKSAPSVAPSLSDKDENGDKVRRRRRSKSRRRYLHTQSQSSKKTRGLFNIDWESVRDCKSCKSKAITRKLCSKRSDNELYRSNSFKFERFVRGSEEISTLGKKISLCDDYSLPVDHINKRRPNSFVVSSLSEWNISSPNEDQIEILETYSNPKDSKSQVIQSEGDSKYYTSPDREYSQPYTTDGSSEPTSDEEFFGHVSVTKPLELNSPDSITEAILPLINLQSPERVDIKRHPSPYYYADLYKSKGEESLIPPKGSNNFVSFEGNTEILTTYKYKKSCSLDEQDRDRESKVFGNTGAANSVKYRKSSSLDTQNIENNALNHKNEPDCIPMPPNRLVSPCSCLVPQDGIDEDDMTRQRHVYETAFDCRISKSDDDLDQIDKVSNHPVLVQLNSASTSANAPTSRSFHRRMLDTVCQNLQEMHVREESVTGSVPTTAITTTISSTNNSNKTPTLAMLVYTPTPPSTAPLPTKFHGKEFSMNSIRSAPSLPSNSNPHTSKQSHNLHHQQQRLKDLRLPVKSLRARMPPSPSPSTCLTGVTDLLNLNPADKNKQHIAEIKDRPRKDSLRFHRQKETLSRETILEYKSCHRRHKFSSTESMTTSSSGGSMESLRSSTSEGNRSTTSSESRHSISLSSHSSDSGGYLGHLTQTSSFLSHSNKLHILSPISDKSSQEPASETSDNNKNNNSQKCSPEEITTPENPTQISLTPVASTNNIKTKRRLPQNKNLLSLAEIQGSDSGISIQSRDGIKSRFSFKSELTSAHQEYSDLPFDMPKLRRRRLGFIEQQDACTSGSTTSVDLRDLPFDMPKLRRRLRVPQSSTESSVSQASSSQSVMDTDKQVAVFRPKLTLNLADAPRPALNLNITNSTITTTSTDLIDITLPLERQGWYHGAITRVEAECVLRLLREGSFLVRNSESARQDYSLSLKSARGFMHMRIQRSTADDTFILGQFSKPFHSIPEMIRHFSLNRLPVRGAEHMCLLQPVIAQLL